MQLIHHLMYLLSVQFSDNGHPFEDDDDDEEDDDTFDPEQDSSDESTQDLETEDADEEIDETGKRFRRICEKAYLTLSIRSHGSCFSK